MRNITYDQFVEEFKPITNAIAEGDTAYDNTMFETFGEELDFVLAQPKDVVWTLLDNGDVISGYHLVNRLGYFITEVPFTEDIEVPEEEREFMVRANIDWVELRKQKQALMIAIDYYDEDQKEVSDDLLGILHFIDNIQDNAVDSGEWSEEQIFGTTEA